MRLFLVLQFHRTSWKTDKIKGQKKKNHWLNYTEEIGLPVQTELLILRINRIHKYKSTAVENKASQQSLITPNY